jgi:FtsP/CotA-like multicopper oxidase with cupredoxin domain
MSPYIAMLRQSCTIALIATLAAGLPSQPLADEAKRFTLNLVDGQPRDARQTLRVTEGDDVVIGWTSDRPVDLHLHGYDVHASPAPGQPAEMAFRARASGRFAVEAHGAGEHRHRPVVYIEVYPK